MMPKMSKSTVVGNQLLNQTLPTFNCYVLNKKHSAAVMT